MINGVVTTLTNCIQEADKDNWKVTVIHPGQFKNFSCPGYPEVKIALPFGLKDRLDRTHDTHIHIATEGPLGIVARNWCVANNVPFTTAYHTKWPEFLREIYKIPTWLSVKFMRWFHNQSACVLTTTETMKSELENQGIGKKVASWTRGVDLKLFRSPRVRASGRSKPRLVSVGRISKEKNLDAFCQLPASEYELVIVGDGPYRAELKAKYPHVKFTGMLKGRALVKEYTEADVMVFSSLHDTFGLVMIESMYQGTPVAAFPVTGPLDVIQEGITGAMDEVLADAVKKALKLNRKKVSDTARARWTWRNAWEKLRDNLS